MQVGTRAVAMLNNDSVNEVDNWRLTGVGVVEDLDADDTHRIVLLGDHRDLKEGDIIVVERTATKYNEWPVWRIVDESETKED